MLAEVVTHPVRFLKMCLWLATLAARSPLEFAKIAGDLPTACHFARRCRAFGARHIHVHFASRSLSLGIMIAMLVRAGVSCTAHAFDIFTRSSASLRARLGRCSFVAAISRFNIRHLRERCGDRVAGLCHVVHCGVDLDRFKPAERQPKPGRMLSVAKMVPKKGLDVAIEACARLRRRNVDFQFDIVGDGPARPQLEKAVRRLDLSDRVHFLGALPNDRLLPLLREAAVFLLPCVSLPSGDRDGIPVVLMEAMACEVPVVSTRISGIPELVEDGVSGRLVSERDPDALADAVAEILAKGDEAARIGRAGRRRVQDAFDVSASAARLRELIAQAGRRKDPDSAEASSGWGS